MTGDSVRPNSSCVAQMRDFEELCRLNPALRDLLKEAELDTTAQLNNLRMNARESAAFSFFNDLASGDGLAEQARQLENAIRNYLKKYPPLTPRPRRGRL